jgi:ElaA protein
MMMDWQWQTFSQLSGQDLYSVLAARQQVFLLEQQCLYPDMDGLDLDAHHLLGSRTIDDRRQIVAYLRCLAPGAKYAEMSLGRVLTIANNRGAGLGRELMVEGIARAERQHPGHRIRIGAQLYLEHFYTDLGFQSVSDPYDDDGIMHIDMLR